MISSRPPWLTLFVLTLTLAATAVGQPAHLVEDVATAQLPTLSLPFDYYYFVEMDGRVYFGADDGIHGRELWTSDGSEAGTHLVADVCPGYCSSQAAWITVAGDRLFFVADDGAHGRELWTSDGTAAGTRLVADLHPGLWSSSPTWLTADGNDLYFAAADGVHGRELWASDGTAAGTGMVADLRPGTEGSGPDRLTLLPAGLFFSADDGVHGHEPWISGGSAATTLSLGDLRSGPESSINPVEPQVAPSFRDWSPLGGRLVFTADDGLHGSEPWTTDGTPGGTTLLADLHGSGGSQPAAFLELAGRLYFRADTPATGAELFSTDAVSDTQLVADLDASPASTNPLPLAVAGGLLYLSAGLPATGSELWKTDGTAVGTAPVADINPGSASGLGLLSFFSPPAALGDEIVFFADDGNQGNEPWISDGTEAGTRPLRDVLPGPESSGPAQLVLSPLRSFGDRVLFWAADLESGLEPWISDGTEAGTRRLADVDHQESALQVCAWFHCPQRPGAVDGYLHLQLSDAAAGAEPWISRGSAGSTRRLADLNPAVRSGFGVGSFPFFFTAAGSGVVFDARTSDTAENQLFASQGGFPPNGAWFPTSVEQVGDAVYPEPAISAFGFALLDASDPVAGRELWRSDGTDAGTERMIDLNPGPNDSSPTSLTRFGDEVYFAATVAATGRELYATDGSAAGTRQVADLRPGAESSSPSLLTVSGGRLFFAAETGAASRGLWVSDGTPEGTVHVFAAGPGSGAAPGGSGPPPPGLPSDPEEMVAGRSGVVDGVFVAAGGPGYPGQEMWWSDGSQQGTRFLGDLFPGPRGSEPRHLTSLDGRAYFAADDGTHGRELWTSDGTADGTRMVIDLVPGAGSSLPAWLTPVDGVLYFTAHRADVGTELWRTDGTTAGTKLVQDVFPGPSPSTPELLTVAGRRLYFTANDGTHGFELWSMLLPGRVPRIDVTASGDFFPRGRVTFTVLFHNPPPDALPDFAAYDELTLRLPDGLQVLRLTADLGVAEWEERGNPSGLEETGVHPPPVTLVRWNGSLDPGQTLTLVVEAELAASTAGETLAVHATAPFDDDRDGNVDDFLLSDDPSLPGDMDPTEIVVAAQAVEVPTASEVGLALLALLLAAAAVGRLRRRVV